MVNHDVHLRRTTTVFTPKDALESVHSAYALYTPHGNDVVEDEGLGPRGVMGWFTGYG